MSGKRKYCFILVTISLRFVLTFIFFLFWEYSGYSDKLNVLMGRIVDAMIALPEKLDSELFERIKDKVRGSPKLR